MIVMLGGAYRDIRQRVAELVAGLDDEQLRTPVPAILGWTVRDVLAYLVGSATGTASGNFDAAPDERWTARHISERRDRSLAELLDEWEHVGPQAEAKLMEHGLAFSHIMTGAVIHEARLRQALGLEPGDESTISQHGR